MGSVNDVKELGAVVGGFTKSYLKNQVRIGGQAKANEIRAAWAKLGVDAEIHSGNFFFDGKHNIYKIDGKEVNRDTAIKHAMEVVGKQLEWGSWNR